MNFNEYKERQNLYTSILTQDSTITFADIKDWIIRCKPTTKELKEILNDIIESNKIKDQLYNNGVTKWKQKNK